MGLVADGYCVTWDRRVKWGIQLECTRDLWVFDGIKPKDRKAALQNYRRFAKHGSMACILINDKVIEFALIHWDEDLSKQPPVFVVQIDTALFAYEPVLEAIEDIKDMPLRADFLG